MSLQKKMDNFIKDQGDWREGKTLPICILYMFENEIMCDVTFRVGESRKTINAHKNILASRSLVFHTMFEGSLPEKGEINIPDIDEDTFNNILRYAYSDQVQISTSNVNRVFYAADKYMLSTLKTTCCEFLKSSAQSANAVVTLSTANQFNLADLQKESLQYIEENTDECLLSSHAVQLNTECVQMIVTSEYLSCSETEVCKFFLKWNETQCKMQGKEVNSENLRAIAGEMVFMIKFPLVEKTYFSNKVSRSMLLTTDEILSVFRYHFGEQCLLFSDKPRCLRGPNKNGQTKFIYRHTIVSNGWCSTEANALYFRLNKSIWIKGCIIFGPNSTYESDSKFTFELSDMAAKRICHEILDIRSASDLHETVPCKLIDPIQLNADEQYTIIVRDIKPTTYYGNNCNSICAQDGIIITFDDSPKSKCDTNVNRGQIAGIMFSI